MLKIFNFCFSFVVLSLIHTNSWAQDQPNTWSDKPAYEIAHFSDRKAIPIHFRTLSFDLDRLRSTFQQAPMEGSNAASSNSNNCLLLLPLPDGTAKLFQVIESPVMEKELANTYPSIKTFLAQQTDQPSVTARLDVTELGFHAMIMAPSGWSFIEPVFIGNTTDYISYYKQDARSSHDFICGVSNETTDVIEKGLIGSQNAARSNGTRQRTYRLALACTGEYAAVFGGTKSAALSAMITSVNRVTGVYEKEVSIRLVLIGNDSLLIYTNSTTDPYTNSSGSTMLTENQNNITSVIGSANYDIGHVFSTGGGGIAGLGVVCSSTNKARGVTGSSTPFNDQFDIDYVAHEIGHQFNGNHTFNSVTGSCGGSNRNAATAVEVGSGITIMAYAGICGTDDLALHSIPYFHTKSFEEIVVYTNTGNGRTCPDSSANGNNAPTVNAGSDYSIPITTPFTLTGSGSDPDGDVLTYSWEEMDVTTTGGAYNQTQVANLDFPLFRPFAPVSIPSRTFPQISDIVNNVTTIGERLPTVARVLDFRLTARDNRIGGSGVTYNDITKQLTVVAAAGPFTVTAPNTAVTWTSGSTQTVTWNVANTTASPVSCSNVKISLSNDGGFTYPTIILASTTNDGTESIIVPNVITTQARIKIEAIGNIFFDISNVNFTIVTGAQILSVISTQSLSNNNLCEGSSVAVSYTTNGTANSGNIFTAQLSNASGSFLSGVVAIGTLNSVNAGTISATIPLGTTAGSLYRIRVISSNPVVNGSDNGANISIFAIPATAGTISGSSTVCQGQNGVAYSVSSIANATIYNWNLPMGATIASGANTANITVNFSASASTPLVFTVSGSNAGCSGTASPNFNVTVNSIPSAAGVISGTTLVCQGQTGVNYIVPIIPGATGYSWIMPSGATITSATNINSITVSFSSVAIAGNISVAGSNGCGTGSSSSLAIGVNASPASPTISSNGSASVCSPSTVTLSFTPSASTSYQWRMNGVNINGATSSSYIASQTGNYDVVATMIPQNAITTSTSVSIPDNSCTGASSPIAVSGYGTTINSSGISVKVNITHTYDGDLALFLQAPTGEILGLSNRVGSSGDNFTNTVFADSGSARLPTTGAPYTGLYKPWTNAFSVCIISTDSTFAGLGSGALNPNGTWTLRAFDAAAIDTGIIQNWTITLPLGTSNCSSSSNVINVIVASNVTTGISISASPSNTVCAGTPITFTATPTNSGSTPGYQWKKNGANVGTNSNIYTNSSTADHDSIICILTSNAACVIGSPATSNLVVMTVNPVVTASVSINVSPSNTVCAGTTVTYTATPTNPGSTPSYQWKKKGANVGTNSNIYTNPSPADHDSITCIMTSNATCIAGSPATSNLLVMVVSNLNPSITGFSPSSGITGTIVTLTGSGFTGTSSINFNGINAGFTVDNNSQITTSVPVGATTGLIHVTTICGSGNSSSNFTVLASTVLNLELFIEGFYSGGGMMRNAAGANADTIVVQLYNTSNLITPYMSRTTLLSTDGKTFVVFPDYVSGHICFIAIRQRNSVETWSKNPVSFAPITNFSFKN